jgi:predicted glycosyltransferase
MARYLFSSHDGFGLGHVRRNTLIARAVLAREPDAEIALVTGLPVRPSWLGDPRMRVVPVPPLVKDSTGGYRHSTLPFEEAVRRRASAFAHTVRSFAPDVVTVDRHPYGLAGELRAGLHDARRAGAKLVLGLRDVLDEPAPVRQELAGAGWDGVGDLFDDVLVYGERRICDHEREYGLPVSPRYCGWVTESVPAAVRDPDLLVVTGGGGGDGEDVFRLGAALAGRRSGRTVLVAGPFAARRQLSELTSDPQALAQLSFLRDVPGCAPLFARAGAVVQMAGYNSTFEALAAGVRPVLVPRRSPRREQAIRASRLAALGLADVVDEKVEAEEVAWLLGRPRLLEPGALELAGIPLDGASRAAAALVALAGGGAAPAGPETTATGVRA